MKRTVMQVEIDDPRLRFLVFHSQVSIFEHPSQCEKYVVKQAVSGGGEDKQHVLSPFRGELGGTREQAKENTVAFANGLVIIGLHFRPVVDTLYSLDFSPVNPI